MACYSLLQWTTFCQTSPPWPVRLGWPHTAWFSSIELNKAVVMWSDWLVFCDYVLVCLPSDALSQCLPSYLGFSYLGSGLSLHGCSSQAQPLLLTLGEGCLLTAAPPDLKRGVAPLGPPAPMQQPLLGGGVAPLGWGPWPLGWGSSSWALPLTSGVGKLLLAATPELSQPGALGHYPWPRVRGSSSRPCFCVVHHSQRA